MCVCVCVCVYIEAPVSSLKNSSMIMAGNPRVSTELLIPKKWNNVRDRITTSPDRTRVWIEPKSKTPTTPEKVAVLYYLSRNGHLEHPHLIEVALPSSSQGLYLRDVINGLNIHRGKGMANMYSWSSKQSYKNGYVWHDVSEDDLIHPTNSHDYILKGTELLQTSPEYESNSTQTPPETNTSSADDSNSSTAIRPRRNQSWSSFDNPQKYVVYKCESSRELAAKFATDAATQTTEEKRRRRSVRVERKKESVGQSVELSREDMVSPPQLNSSEDGSYGVSGLGDVDQCGEIRHRTAEGRNSSGRMKASKMLMQLISCGTVSVKGVGMRSKQELF